MKVNHRLRLLLSVLVATVFAAQAAAAGIVFRYVPGRTATSSPVVASGVEEVSFVAPRDLPARGPGGWGLAAPRAAAFTGPASTLQSAANTALSQALGPKLTVEAWAHLAATTGRQVFVTNRVGAADGLMLYAADGTPAFSITYGGQTYTVAAGRTLPADESFWLAATAEYAAGRLRLSIYLDGRPAGEATFAVSIASPYPIARPFYLGTEAGGTPEAPVLTGSLNGHLLGAVVRDYVAKALYLNSSVPKDGGVYLGLPAFHDQPVDVFHLPMDQRLTDSPSPLRYRWFLPFLNDEYVPQGTASAFEVDGADTTAVVYVAYYHKTRAGKTGGRRSLIAEIDARTGQMRRAFRLMGRLGYSHAGGLAYVRGAIYVGSASWLERYPLPPYEGPTGPKYYDLSADPSGSIQVEGKASFVSAYHDSLWVGDYRTASETAPYLYAYALKADGRPIDTDNPTVYALPRNIQGVDFQERNGEIFALMTRNRNAREAEVLRVPRSRLSPYQVPAADSTILLPRGIEDLSFFPDGTLWTNSESGADYYQLGDPEPWPMFFPFVYGVARSVYLPGGTTTAIETPGGAARETIGLERYPNPFVGSTTVAFRLPAASALEVTVVDLLGRRVAVLADERRAAEGEHRLRWDAGAQPAGTYFVVVQHDAGRAVVPVTLIR